jgi:hypothetical protein
MRAKKPNARDYLNNRFPGWVDVFAHMSNDQLEELYMKTLLEDKTKEQAS